jgi:hypothetical protein
MLITNIVVKKTRVHQVIKSDLGLFSYFRVYINFPGKLLLALASTVIMVPSAEGTHMKPNLLLQGRSTD